jgi:transcriptional regulator with XRE-family HTH domain
VSALSDLLTEVNDGRYSARALARRAQERGHTLNHDTAARYLRGSHGRPDEATLRALADALGVPLGRLRTAAGLSAELTAPYTPPPEASRLNRRQRRAVDEIIRAMLDTDRAGVSDDLAARRAGSTTGAKGAAKAAATPAKGAPRAARRGKPEPSG